MEEKEEALRKTEEAHHATVEDINSQHQQVICVKYAQRCAKHSCFDTTRCS